MLAALPEINACLNGLAFVLLLAGLAAIKAGRRRLHRALMLSAFGVSALFLACYVTHHLNIGGSKPFPAVQPWKALYLAILIPHVILAIVMLPPIFRALFLAHRERFAEHRRAARWALGMWLYVSLSGVAVYLMLYQWAPRLVAVGSAAP